MTSNIGLHETWESGDRYERFMGRWSSLVAQRFLDWLSPSPGLRWLDVGAGSGALSAAIASSYAPSALSAIDLSLPFLLATRLRLGGSIGTAVGSAASLPFAPASVDVVVSGLMLNFVPEPEKAVSEMVRVAVPGGLIAIYIWDYTGTMEFLSAFWSAATRLDPMASELDESRRFPDSTAHALRDKLDRAGLDNVQTVPLEIRMTFRHFDDYWQPFLGGQGPAPTYVQSLTPSQQEDLKLTLQAQLPVLDDGSILLAARAWAAQGQVPASSD